MTWRDRLATNRAQNFQKRPDEEPPKLPEITFGGFGSTPDRPSAENSDPEGPRAMQERLLALAERLGLPRTAVARLGGDDLDACAGCTDDELGAFLWAVDASAAMKLGKVPRGFTVAACCPACGPVWLSEPLHPAAQSCPWCVHRRAGGFVPRPA